MIDGSTRFIVEPDSNWFCSCLIQMLITGFRSIATNRESGRLSKFLYMRHTIWSSINISRDNLNRSSIICRSSLRVRLFLYCRIIKYQLYCRISNKKKPLHAANTYNALWILICVFDNYYYHIFNTLLINICECIHYSKLQIVVF